ncbi:MAG: hypothetical protein US25_C0080G0004 [Candidatus Moranbacteria bacterium GW2011_GWE1_36_7]|nr:MAG: hypothetical protein US25_C0080G0004 [Candidatus Moranbacteria bacterium GW2011_GWE1_36_7]
MTVKKRAPKGIVTITSPSTQGHNIVDNWNEYRVVEPVEILQTKIENSERINQSSRSAIDFEQAVAVSSAFSNLN